MPASRLAVGDHLRIDQQRAAEHDCTPGTYRVVGTPDDRVTLLRVGDADGRRVNAGELVSLTAGDAAALPDADNPDGNRPVGTALVGALRNVWWQLRTFTRSLAARPLPALGALALIAAGYVSDDVAGVPDLLGTALVVVGALALASLGSRWAG